MYHCHSFANLTSVSVRFERFSHRRFYPSPPYSSDYHAREMGLYRSNMISLLLATLMYRDPTSTHLRKISFENLQTWPETYLAKRAADFESLCSRLETLKLPIVSGEASDDRDYRSTEIQRTEFFEQLGLFWLRPTMRSLSTLSLYGDNGQGYWGYAPKADLRGLHFPHLHALTLGAYLSSYDWPMEWLASHAATLKHLDLDGCAILVFARRLATLDTDGYPRSIVDSPTRREAYNSCLRSAMVRLFFQNGNIPDQSACVQDGTTAFRCP